MPKMKVNMRDKVMAAATSTVNVVRCSVCNKMHEVDSEEYIVVYGNITVGLKKHLISDNIDDKGKISGSNIFCRTARCFDDIFNIPRSD